MADQATRHSQTFLLVNAHFALSYVVSARLQVEIGVPVKTADVNARFLNENGDALPGFTSIHHRTETLLGVGDTSLSGRYRLLMPNTDLPFLADLVLGISVPTGNIEPDPFALGRKGESHQHIFFGTGTFDPHLGIDLQRPFDDWTLRLDTAWNGALYRNRYEYRGPHVLLTSLSATSTFAQPNWSFQTGVELFKEYPAQWASQAAKNSGRLDLSPVLGVAWRNQGGLSISLILKRPFILSTRGSELNVPFLMNFGGAYDF